MSIRPVNAPSPDTTREGAIGAALRQRVDALLTAAADTVTVSHADGYGSSLTRSAYSRPPRFGLAAPADRPSALCLHLPDGTHWPDGTHRPNGAHGPGRTHGAPEPLLVLGRPVQHPERPGLFAGVAVAEDGPRCWIADAPSGRITDLGIVPAVFPADEAPLAWTGRTTLTVAVAAAPEPPPATAHIFEAARGERIRLTATDRLSAPRPARLVTFDVAGAITVDGGAAAGAYPQAASAATHATGAGETAGGIWGGGSAVAAGVLDHADRPADPEARQYRSVRGALTGHVAACAVDEGGATLVIGGPGRRAGLLIPMGRPPRELCWLTSPRAAHVVALGDRPDGLTISSYAATGGAAGTEQVLLHDDGLLPVHWCVRRDLLVVLTLGPDSYGLVVVAPGARAPTVRRLALPLRPPAVIKIADVLPDALRQGGPRVATVDTDDNLTIWAVPPEGPAATRVHAAALPRDRELVALAAWDPGDVRPVLTARRARGPLPVHPGGPAPIHGEAAHAAARFTLHLPEERPAVAGLVWLSQAAPDPAPDRTGGGGHAMIDPCWLTLAGCAVLDLRITPAWWPDIPDEEIRPRLVRQILDAVDASGIDRHLTRPAHRLAVGGASFGATLALVALAECDRFAAAIAQSGAYSRHLTPLGFQDEPRTLWEAPGVYRDFDAVVNAPRIRRPVLIVHGEADQNPATPLLQATLLFQALTANGTRARLVVLPGEGHVPMTGDGIATALAEKAAWLHALPAAEP